MVCLRVRGAALTRSADVGQVTLDGPVTQAGDGLGPRADVQLGHLLLYLSRLRRVRSGATPTQVRRLFDFCGQLAD